jgi:hypothetical protein
MQLYYDSVVNANPALAFTSYSIFAAAGHFWDLFGTPSGHIRYVNRTFTYYISTTLIHFAHAESLTNKQHNPIIDKVSTNGADIMDKQVASERLRALASDDKKRSKAARLRDVIDDVEAALSAGISRADVVAELAALGLEMSLATFGTALTRLRQKRGKTPSTKVVPVGQVITQERPQQEAAPTAGASAETTTSAAGSHVPRIWTRLLATSQISMHWQDLQKGTRNESCCVELLRECRQDHGCWPTA